jgi:hypothetical protein
MFSAQTKRVRPATGRPAETTARVRHAAERSRRIDERDHLSRGADVNVLTSVAEFSTMNISESLVGHLLTRNGTKYLIIKANDTSVVAAYRDASGVLQRVNVPLAEALQCLDDLDEVYVADAVEPEPVEPRFTLVD